ncbi:unnamed protein product [Hymenolepis diminuta]|uniref:EGF-like domain-containing protein n=1 Tax=Hymenolepis diminuta TaxID=6216 RepID=A0A0R3SB41_HYMDI|nr:unnamed protein product [Hymenolepis diminuta]
MEIEIENPGESKGEKVIHEFSMEENCLLGRSCNSGGICIDTTTLPNLSVSKGTCVCPLGYSGKFCDQKSFQTRFPEIQDGGYLAFGGWLLPKIGPFSVSLQIKPHVLRPKTLLFFYFSISRAQAFYLELDNGILQLRIYNKSIEGYFYLSRLLQHPTELNILNKNFFDISFGLRKMNELYLSLDHNEVHGVLETLSSEEGFGLLINSFNRENTIFIGGHSSLTKGQSFPIVSAAENSLIGCIGDIVINGHLCDPRQGSYVGDAVSGYGIIDCSRNVCDNHVCENDAACKPVSATDYVCQCPLGTRPPSCKQDRIPIIPEFLGNSYLSLKGYRDTSLSETLLEITFLPKKPTGLLIYSGFSFDKRGDFISISLVNSQVFVGFDLGSGPASMQSSQNVTLNYWQTVRVKRIGRSFDVYLNDEHISPGLKSFSQGNLVQLTIADDLLVGGHPDPDRISALLPKYDDLVSYKAVKGFVGCVQSVNVQNENEIEGFVNGKSIISVDLEQFGNYVCNRTVFYIGGAPQSLIDKIEFLREFISEIEIKGKIGGFIGCIRDIRINHSPVDLRDATKEQNIGLCTNENS